MLLRLAFAAAALLTTASPALAHELAAEHVHADGIVIFTQPPAIAVGLLVAVAVLALLLVAARRAARTKAGRNDPR